MGADALVKGWPARFVAGDAEPGLSRGDQACQFIEAYCRITKASVGGAYGSKIVLRPWQRALIRYVLSERADGSLLFRLVLVGVARKNTKTTLFAALGLWALCCGPEGGEIYSVAGDREQARLTFETAKNMVKMDPELSQLLLPLKNSIKYEGRNSEWFVLSSDAKLREGANPTFVLLDELHVVPEELFNVFYQAMGARDEPLMVCITTAGDMFTNTGEDTICYRLYKDGVALAEGEADDNPTFGFAWWQASSSDCDIEDPDEWEAANPGLGDLLSLEDLESVVVNVKPADFQTKRLNLFVESTSRWMDMPKFRDCKSDREPIPGEPITLGLDGSMNDDSTALIATTLDGFHQWVAGLWERPEDDPDWEVPYLEVEERVDAMFEQFDVRRMYADPFRWHHSLSRMRDKHGDKFVLNFPNTNPRMAPACSAYYQAVSMGALTHSGDKNLDRHMRNCAEKKTDHGIVISKPRSGRGGTMKRAKIDAAVASVMSFAAATTESMSEDAGDSWGGASWEDI